MIRFAQLTGILLAVADVASAQSYRVRVDARAQAVSYRGLAADSIAMSDVVPGPNGGFATPDGYAVQCHNGVWCYFYRPGERTTSCR
jgi:hypothetical protein